MKFEQEQNNLERIKSNFNMHFFSNFPKKQYMLFLFLRFVSINKKYILILKWDGKSKLNICGKEKSPTQILIKIYIFHRNYRCMSAQKYMQFGCAMFLSSIEFNYMKNFSTLDLYQRSA